MSLKFSKNSTAPYDYYSEGTGTDPIVVIGTITGTGGTITTSTATIHLVATVFRYLDITISAINETLGIVWQLSLDNVNFYATITPADMTALVSDQVTTMYAKAVVVNDGSILQPPGGVFNAPNIRITAFETGDFLSGIVQTVDGIGPDENGNVVVNGGRITEIISNLDTSTLTGSHRIGTGNIRLPITKTYTTILGVDVVLRALGAGSSWILDDTDTTIGPHIRILDGLAATDAVIDVVIEGL